jgi:glycosyltransferase involved in cell wall biosynthesis
MAILEGMAAGRPWLATPVGAIPLVLRDGHNGILFPTENVEALATSMSRLLHNVEERLDMGTRARALIESEFSASRMSEDYLRVYSGARMFAQSRGPAR